MRVWAVSQGPGPPNLGVGGFWSVFGAIQNAHKPQQQQKTIIATNSPVPFFAPLYLSKAGVLGHSETRAVVGVVATHVAVVGSRVTVRGHEDDASRPNTGHHPPITYNHQSAT